MTVDLLFTLCNSFVLPGWLLLVFLPRWKWTIRLVCAVLIPMVLATVYLGLLLTQLEAMFSGGGFGSIASISALFQNPHLLTLGWVHYLAFDLFIGTWIVSDSQAQRLSHGLVLPCLPLTFMFGPVGLLAYYVIRVVKTRSFLLYQGLPAN